MKNNMVIIQGSSRSQGDTYKIIQHLNKDDSFDIIDLKKYQIGHFDYEFKNSDDDFYPLIKKLIEDYDTMIFATPIYWYTMSGILKVFIDRISDLLKTHKDLGRQLRGKRMSFISVSNGNDQMDSFSTVFKETAGYLGMDYINGIHTWVHQDAIPLEVQSKLGLFNLKFKKIN